VAEPVSRVFHRLLFMTDQPSVRALEPVQLTVDALPSDVAEQIRSVQAQDPEFLRRVLLYGITHKTVFETLGRGWGV
jgi:hypothetical protein